MASGNLNKLARCASIPELLLDGGLLTEHMAAANAEDLSASVAMLVNIHILVEEQRDAPLSIIGHLPLLSSNRHAERSSQEATKVVGGVDVGGDAQKGLT